MNIAGAMAGLVVAACTLAGCIPHAVVREPPQAVSEPISGEPRIEPAMETLNNEAQVWELRPVVADAVVVTQSRYVVGAGDTLRSVATKTGAGSDAIAKANGLSRPYLVKVGQLLQIPTGRYHRVDTGQTGIAIARAYAIDWQMIIDANALVAPYTLRVGQKLHLPNAQPQTLEARAAAFRLDIDDILSGGEPAVATDAQPSVRPTLNRPLSPEVAIAEPSRFSGVFDWPATGAVVNKFGPAGEGEVNRGITLNVVQNASIVSAADGIVAFVGDNVASFSGLILVKHGGGWITAYGNAAKSSVTRGQSIKRGQTIGRAGTGSNPQLFFQMRKGGVAIDPLKYLPDR